MSFTRQDKTQICIIIFTQLRSEVGRSKFVVVVLFLFCLFVCLFLFVCVLFFVGFFVCVLLLFYFYLFIYLFIFGGVVAMPDMGGFVVVAA